MRSTGVTYSTCRIPFEQNTPDDPGQSRQRFQQGKTTKIEIKFLCFTIVVICCDDNRSISTLLSTSRKLCYHLLIVMYIQYIKTNRLRWGRGHNL